MWQFLKSKRFWIIGLVILAVILISWFLYLWLRPTVQPSGTTPGGQTGFPTTGPGTGTTVEPGTGNLPGTDTTTPGGIGTSPGQTSPVETSPLVTTDPAVKPDTSSGRLRYYNPQDCKFYEIDASGVKRVINQTDYCSVQNITWAQDSGKAVLEFPDGANVVYDFKTKKQYTLPKEMTEFSFSPDSSQIAGKYLADSVNDRWVVTINSDGSGLTGVEPMGENASKVKVEWAPNNQVVALSATGTDNTAFSQQILLIGFHQENFKGLYVDGRGFNAQWTPDGQKLLYSVYSDKTDFKPTLWLTNASTDNVGTGKRQLNIATWADKCTIVGESAYCSAPQQMPQGAGLVPELAVGQPDDIWKVDLKTGSTILLSSPINDQGQGISVGSLTISKDGRWLYFTDSGTRQLRSVKLTD
ncbi:MAG: TolB family protein [Patescibacteria group bacterium]